MVDVSIYFLAFGGGLVSFISPCNAALIPTFTSYISTQSKGVKENFLMSLFFAIGYAFMFSIIGLILNSIDNLIMGIRYINLISGIIIILMAIYLLFSKSIMSLSGTSGISSSGIDGDGRIEITLNSAVEDGSPNKERLEIDHKHSSGEDKKYHKGYIGAFMLGFSLGSAFIPCITPMYASILTLSFQYSSSVRISLLFLYALGLTLPFLFIGLLIGKIKSSERMVVSIVRYGKVIQRVFSVFLLWIGVEIILTGYGYGGIIPVI